MDEFEEWWGRVGNGLADRFFCEDEWDTITFATLDAAKLIAKASWEEARRGEYE